MNSTIQLRTTTPSLLISFALSWMAAGPNAQALVPAPDGGYPGGNTAEGQNALGSLTTGTYNTAAGIYSLLSLTDGSFCTGVGAGTLLANIADENTATGAGALFSNTTGFGNTANGAFTLFSNTTGEDNTATGAFAFFSNTTGNNNTVNGFNAFYSNTTGSTNTAIGRDALNNNTTGGGNTALGFQAGNNATTGSDNVYIGKGMVGVAGENNACYIKSIFGQTSTNGIPVLINSDNKLGTTTSSKRFKEEIKPIGTASEALLGLKPVTFRYKKEIDPAGTPQLGLVAEEVEKVNPDLVVRDKEGKPYSVRYDQVNAMLLNEFLKEHRKVEALEAAMAQQQKFTKSLATRLEQQTAQMRAMGAQLPMNKAETRVAIH